jgi:tetratricopeptide (TPR) repeat protein
MSKQYLPRLSRLLWFVVILLGFAAISWTAVASSFAGNVGLLIVSRSLARADQVQHRLQDNPDLMRAQQWLQAATQINTANAGAWRGQGVSLAAQGQEQEALAAWQAAGITGQELIQQGETARLAGDSPEALVWYERAAKLDPGLLSSILYYRFLAQRDHGDADSAFDSLHRAIVTDQGWVKPEIRFRAWHSWGVRLVEQQRNSEAEQALQTAISVFPNDPLLRTILSETYRFLGLAQWAQGKLDQAVNSLETAVQVDSHNVWAHIHYGKVLYLQDPSHLAETENEFTIALGLSSNNADAWKSLIGFWRLMKKPEKADLLCSRARATAVASLLTECMSQ